MPERELETKIGAAVKRESDRLSIEAQKAGIVKATAVKVTTGLVRNVLLALREMVTIDNSIVRIQVRCSVLGAMPTLAVGMFPRENCCMATQAWPWHPLHSR